MGPDVRQRSDHLAVADRNIVRPRIGPHNFPFSLRFRCFMAPLVLQQNCDNLPHLVKHFVGACEIALHENETHPRYL